MTSRNNIPSQLLRNYNQSSIQLTSLNKTPNSIFPNLQQISQKFSPQFTDSIQSQQNPSKAYKKAIKNLFLEQLNRSLHEQTNKKQIETKKDKESIDGVLCQFEKNSQIYYLLLQKKIDKQEKRNQKFIDEGKRKSQMIDTFIEKQYDSNLFNRESDMYQQHQRNSLQHSLSMLNIQRQSKVNQNQKIKQEKYREFQQRMQYERTLEQQKQQQRKLHKQNQVKYQQQLQFLVGQKKQRNIISNNSSMITNLQSKRHNPITNPIQYHIDNPYLLKRMADHQRT